MHKFSFQDIRYEINMTTDFGDRWGSIMNSLFACANELHRRGQNTPSHWEYSPSPFGCEEADSFAIGDALTECSSQMILALGEYLLLGDEIERASGNDY